MASVRGKRSAKADESPAKKTKRLHSSCSDDETGKGPWTLRATADFPTTSIYNCTSRSQPAELFRKDLISAMKLADSEPLGAEDYWLIGDQWKQEWEKGVQVPVNPEAAPLSRVRVTRKRDKAKDFKLPDKYVRTTHDEFFSNERHQMSNALAQAKKMCRYDLDACDTHWLEALNEERNVHGLLPIQELTMELVMEELEIQSHSNIQHAIKTEAGLGIEYDEDVICDVCRSPDSEEGNEMVFCDACNVCVHQACYGITNIPEGSWLCRTCVVGSKPSCLLCPNKGGAMKSTRSGQKWTHVSCALWIPEVIIGCVEKMEPITKISQIPASRWALVCCICRERAGACIQCSIKTCKTAYHVTCGFQDGLEMRTIVEDDNDDDGVKFRSYCPKHSKHRCEGESSDSDDGEIKKHRNKRKKPKPYSKKEITYEEKANVRAQRLLQIESEFYKYVNMKKLAKTLVVDAEVADFIFNYWKLKRRASFNQPLMSPKAEEIGSDNKKQDDSVYDRLRMFVHLRQDLERVRNLCYMVSRREKLARSWCEIREEIFRKQVAVLTNRSLHLSQNERNKVIHAAHGSTVYDQLYSADISCCAPRRSPVKDQMRAANGLIKSPCKTAVCSKLPNPYAKTYFNGRSQRRCTNGVDGEGTVCGNSTLTSTDLDHRSVEASRLHVDAASGNSADAESDLNNGCVKHGMADSLDCLSALSVRSCVPTKFKPANQRVMRNQIALKTEGVKAETTDDHNHNPVPACDINQNLHKADPTDSLLLTARDKAKECGSSKSLSSNISVLQTEASESAQSLDKTDSYLNVRRKYPEHYSTIYEDGCNPFRGKENTCKEKQETKAAKMTTSQPSIDGDKLPPKCCLPSDVKHSFEAEPPSAKKLQQYCEKKKGSKYHKDPANCNMFAESKNPQNLQNKIATEEAVQVGRKCAEEQSQGKQKRFCRIKGEVAEPKAKNCAADLESGIKKETMSPTRKECAQQQKAQPGPQRNLAEGSSPEAAKRPVCDKPTNSHESRAAKKDVQKDCEAAGLKRNSVQKKKSSSDEQDSAQESARVHRKNGRQAEAKAEEEAKSTHKEKEHSESTGSRERQRQESIQIRESLFIPSRVSTTSLLGGYRIPKKNRSDSCVAVADARINGAAATNDKPPVPPLPAQTPPSEPVTPEKKASSCPAQTAASQENARSPRLIIKLRKDPNYPESSRWRRDSDVRTEVPPTHSPVRQCEKPIRLKIPTKLNVHLRPQQKGQQQHEQPNKYSMRSRTVQDYCKVGGSEPS